MRDRGPREERAAAFVLQCDRSGPCTGIHWHFHTAIENLSGNRFSASVSHGNPINRDYDSVLPFLYRRSHPRHCDHRQARGKANGLFEYEAVSNVGLTVAMSTNPKSVAAAVASSPVSVTAVTVALFLTNLISQFPGVPNPDSDLQYAQAVSGHFTDWHPPIMAWLWSLLLVIKDGTGLLFAVHVFCYWLGFGLIALTLSRIGRNLAAWAIVGVSVLPPLLMQNGQIHKDVGLAVAFLSSFAICFWYRAQNVRIPPAATIIAMALLLYGGLVRSNAVFALPPLIIYMWHATLVTRPLRFLASYIVIAILAIPASDAFNHKVLHAHPTFPLGSLETFDIAGIAHFSDDMSVFGDDRVTKQLLAECFTSVLWDTLKQGGKCSVLAEALGPRPTDKWIAAISRHPLAYAEHRLVHYNHELSTVLLVHHPVDGMYNWKYYVHVTPDTVKQKIVECIRLSSLFSPWFVLVLGLGTLALSFPRSEEDPCRLNSAVVCLAVSGLFYMAAYALIGVASEYRYHYWGMIAIWVATVMCVSEQEDTFLRLTRAGVLCIAVLAAALGVIQITQMRERDALFGSDSNIDERTLQEMPQP